MRQARWFGSDLGCSLWTRRKGGIRRGDRIIAGANEPLRSQKELKDLVLSVGVGDTLVGCTTGIDCGTCICCNGTASVVGLGRQDVQSRGFQWAGATIVEVSETISGELGIEPSRAWLSARSSRDLGQRDLD